MKKMLEYTVVVHQQFSFFFDLNSIKLAPCYIMKCMNKYIFDRITIFVR